MFLKLYLMKGINELLTVTDFYIKLLLPKMGYVWHICAQIIKCKSTKTLQIVPILVFSNLCDE